MGEVDVRRCRLRHFAWFVVVVMLSFAALPASADPVTLVLDERTVRVFIPPTVEQSANQDMMSAFLASDTASTTATLSSSISDLHNLSGFGSAAAETAGATFDNAPGAANRFLTVIAIDSPHAFTLQGTHTEQAATQGDSIFSPALALTQFLLETFDPELGLGADLLFNDVFRSDTPSSGVYSRSGLLQPGYYLFSVAGLTDGADGLGFSTASASFSFNFNLTDTDMVPTPEPASIALISTGWAGIVAARRRRRVKN